VRSIHRSTICPAFDTSVSGQCDHPSTSAMPSRSQSRPNKSDPLNGHASDATRLHVGHDDRAIAMPHSEAARRSSSLLASSTSLRPSARMIRRRMRPACARSRPGIGRYGLAPASRGQTSDRCSPNRPKHQVKTPIFTENVPLRYWAYSRNPPKQINQLLNPPSVQIGYV
jgi:hypothetical protein